MPEGISMHLIKERLDIEESLDYQDNFLAKLSYITLLETF